MECKKETMWRETSLQCDMQMLFYIGLSGEATRRQCGPCQRIFDLLEMGAMPTTVDPTEKASLCVKILQVSKMQQSHVALKKGALRSHVWRKDALELRNVC